MTPMLALTLYRPWPFVIMRMGKRVENRPWRPWSAVIGRRIALHAGKVFDDNVAIDATASEAYRQGIVGTAVVKGWISIDSVTRLSLGTHSRSLTLEEATAAAASPYFFGPYGWVLEDVRELSEPIPCRGARGLWPVPLEVMRASKELVAA